MIARLAPGASIERAQAKLDAQNVRYIERAGALAEPLRSVGYNTKLNSLEGDLVRNVRSALQMLWGGVLFVVLIAAVNIANLSLVRANGRMKELATRNAIGAGGRRIAKQLITEATLLTLIGAGLGIGLGFLSLSAIEWIGFTDLPRAHEISIDGVVLAVTLAPAILLGIVVGAGPALQLARVNLSNVLREEGRSGTAGRTSKVVRRSLVVAQVALAFVLLIGAGLLLASFQRLLGVDPGFVAENVLTGRLNPLATRYKDDAAPARLHRSRADADPRAARRRGGRRQQLPAVQLGRQQHGGHPGRLHAEAGRVGVSPNQLYVSPGYIEAMKMRLKSGRFFNASDTADAPKSVIVDENLARKFWPNQDPVGKRVYLPDSPEDVARPGPKVTWMTVVGVVGEVKMKGLVEGGETARAGAFYAVMSQHESRGIGLAIRSKGDLAATQAAVTRALAEIDPDVPMTDVFTMSARIDKSLNPRRAPMLLSLGFGAVALLLASIGLYGVLAYHVSQRTREIGIRMALGSDAGGIVRLVLGEGGSLVLVGLAIGLGGAVALRGAIASQLYGVGALDPLVMAAAIGVLGATSFVACWGPARRAAKVSPLVALSRQ